MRVMQNEQVGRIFVTMVVLQTVQNTRDHAGSAVFKPCNFKTGVLFKRWSNPVRMNGGSNINEINGVLGKFSAHIG